MALPTLPSITTQFFYLLADGSEHSKDEIVATLTIVYRLTERDLEEATKTGRSKFGNLVDWAQADLVRALLVKELRPQMLTLTEDGRELAAQKPERLDRAFLARKYWHGG